MRKARAADLFGKITGVETQFHRFAFDLGGNFGGNFACAVNEVFMGIDFLLHKAPHRGDDHLLFFGQTKIHGRGSPLAQLRETRLHVARQF